MQWGFSVVMAVATSLMLAGASDAAPKHKKRQATSHVTRHWHGYGFLPGYRPPQRIAWERVRRHGPMERVRRHGPIYYWDARPGYYRGRWNGGGFGPCWERTPIGPMWTCGR